MPERESQDRTAVCEDVAELLPFYLNRSLGQAAADRVEAHLAACAACRREERDARTAWSLHEGHLPVELLLDYALDQPMPSRVVEMIDSHLAVCERCSEEVATVRQEHTAAKPALPMSQPARQAGDDQHAEAEPALAGPRLAVQVSRDGLWALAWAAGLAAIVASAGWFWTWRQLVDERGRSPALSARANVPVVELLPATQPLLRGTGIDAEAPANRVAPSNTPGELVLVLLSAGRYCEAGCVLEIYETGNTRPAWRLEGLTASPSGHLTLALSDEWLSSDRSVLAVRDQAGELVAEYLIEFQQSSVESP